MRGQWFTDGTWLPLEEDESDHIEMEHLARFRGQQMRDTYEMEVVPTAVDSKDAIHSMKLSRSHVDWHSVDEVYLYSDATTSKIARTVTQRLGFSKASSSGTRLHRGYVEEAAHEDTPPETTHIVFVVHGIGQKMDQGRIIRNTSMMRDAARKMEEKHFSDRTTEHVEFLPVEDVCVSSADTVDSITPDKVRGLRDMLNSSAMDIMYYTSPLYRDEYRIDV
ncbi:Phospholipase DDHD1 [Liparis tanakae]|uniref:Phospholipase DDHD1 n=1 Tax=Liparis tanakae TaxID=230148 RepID=A0A4Z2IDR0_9TELE|nr:Phospholipase DDHD1 [Liparis tanakae]